MEKKLWKPNHMCNAIGGVGGVGGAIKALAKNLTNHLVINRPMMKRIVSKVVAEQHSLGRIDGSRGCLFFVRPERYKLVEIVAQAKEAFDEMLLHKERKMRAAMKLLPYNSMIVPNMKAQAGRKVAFMSPTVQNNAPNQVSRTGVVTDMSMVRPKITRQQLQQQFNQKPSIASRVPLPKSLTYKAQAKGPQQLRKTRNRRQMKSNKSKSHQNNTTKENKPIIEQTITSAVRLLAGRTANNSSSKNNNNDNRRTQKAKISKKIREEPPTVDNLNVKSNVSIKRKVLRSKKEKVPMLQRSYDKPWLVRWLRPRNASKQPKISRQYSCYGFRTHQPQKIHPFRDQETLYSYSVSPEQRKSKTNPKSKTNVKPKSSISRQLSKVNFAWYTPYQFPGGAGATANPMLHSTHSARLRSQMQMKTLKARPSHHKVSKQQSISATDRMAAGKTISENNTPVKPPNQYKVPGPKPFHLPPQPQPSIEESADKSGPMDQKTFESQLQRTQRKLRVAIGSSMGSLAEMGMNVNNSANSEMGLTPAKRKLTIAFLDRDRRVANRRANNKKPQPTSWRF